MRLSEPLFLTRRIFPSFFSFLLVFAYIGPASAQLMFEDVTNAAGVDYTGESYGGAWGDANGDGLPDLFVTNHRNRPALFVNMGDGTFEDRYFEVDAWFLKPWSDIHGGTWADYNNDGHSDLVITAGSKNNTQFLVNNGSFLVDRVAEFTFDRKEWGGRFPFWFDYNRDGLLDLAIGAQGAKFHLHKQKNNDFERANFASQHNCVNDDYAHLSDLTMDGVTDWVCVTSGAIPEKIYDYSNGIPFIDRSGLATSLPNIVDSAIADFDGDQIMDIFALRGKVRINGAATTGPNSIQAHLTNSGGNEAGITFKTSGDLSIAIHWSGPNINDVYIGAGGFHPKAADPDQPITMTLSPSDPNVVGLKPHDPDMNRGVYIGYEPATQTWSFFNSSGPGNFSYTYNYLDSTSAISDLEVFGIRGTEKARSPALIKWDGSGYTNQISGSGLAENVLCNAVAAADFDNDMDVDLYYGCRGGVKNRANRLYLNDGTGNFTAAPGTYGAEGPIGSGHGLSENVIVSDYDVDGFIDVFITNGLKLYPHLPEYSESGSSYLFRNLGNSNNWVEFELTGTESNRDGLGAIVTATTGGVTQIREQNGGYHRYAQHDPRIHFGLAGNATVNINVRWPNGQVDNHLNVAANALYELVEGSPTINAMPIPTSTAPSSCGESAGEPKVNANVDRELFIWKDHCGSSKWNVRVTGGAGNTIVYSGTVESDQPLTGVSGVGLEGGDTLNHSPNSEIDYALSVGTGSVDGFKFTVNSSAETCFGVDASGSTALAGSMRTPISMPFDLETLGPCGNVPTANLVTVKTLSSLDTTPAEGDTVTFQIAVTNNGPLAATNVSLTDLLPAGLTATVNNGQTSKGSYNDVSGVWSIGNLALSAGATLTIEGTVDAGQANNLINNTTTAASATQPDSGSAGDVLSASVTVSDPMADLVTVKTLASGNVSPLEGETVTFAITVTNNGPDTASNVSLTDQLPAGMTATANNGLVSQGVYGAGGLWTIGDLLNGGSATLTIEGTVDVGQDGNLITNTTGVATGDQGDPITGNDVLSATIAVNMPLSDLVTVKTLQSGNPSALEGDTVTFAITVTNNGPVSATGVSLVDSLPAGLTATGSNGNVTQGSYAGGTWSVGALLNGASATLTLEGTIDVGQDGNTITNTTGAATGDQFDLDISSDVLSASVNVNNVTTTPLTQWSVLLGGVSATGNRIDYSGNPTGWPNNTARSNPFSSLGYTDDYTVEWTIESDPSSTTWIIGLGIFDQNNNWTDVDYGMRSSNGNLRIYESGSLQVSGPDLAQGDVISMTVSGGSIDFVHNGSLLWTSTYAGSPDFYVDSSFKFGAISLSTIIDGSAVVVEPPTEIPVTSWPVTMGGVTASGNDVSYSGTPTGWGQNSAQSARLSSLGATGNYEVSWTVGSNPAATTWVFGLGISEVEDNWRDVDYAMRSSAGELKVYENGTWRATSSTLSAGDELSIRVNANQLTYNLNGIAIRTSTILGTEDFYLDSSFKDGAIDLSSVTLANF